MEILTFNAVNVKENANFSYIPTRALSQIKFLSVFLGNYLFSGIVMECLDSCPSPSIILHL